MPKQDILPVNAINVSIHVWICIFMHINKRSAILLFIGAIMTSAFITIRPIQGETGKGEDVFKVIMTVFGADKSKGDVAAIVTVNNGEESRVKFLDTDKMLATTSSKSSNPGTFAPSTTNPAAGGGIIEYVATFPNVTVNAGDEYKACVLPVKTLQLICTTGNNSPAQRPEFIDLSLNATTPTPPTPPTPPTTDTQQETMEEGDAIENDNENEGE